MKIALCFHGFMRHYEITYNQIIKNLNLSDKNYDVFIYTNKNNHIKHFDEAKNVKLRKNNLDINFFYNICGEKLKVVKFVEDDEDYLINIKNKFEKLKKYYSELLEKKILPNNEKNINRIKSYINYNINNYLNEPNFRAYPWILRQSDQFLKLYLVSKLMLNYSKENNIEYDIVINIRPDVIICNTNKNLLDLVYKNIKDNRIFCSINIDFCFFTNLKTNEIFLKGLFDDYGTIDNIDDFNSGWFFAPESRSTYYIKKIFEKFELNMRPSYYCNLKNLHNDNKETIENVEELCKKHHNMTLDILNPLLLIIN